jgi:ribosomal protein S18 acetylase RimI-like enzyme
MLNLRKANTNDHDFLVRTDLLNEGYTTAKAAQMTIMEQEEQAEHSNKILKFLTEPDKGAYIFEDTDEGSAGKIAMIMYSICNRDLDYPWTTIFHELDRGLFQQDGRFLEIFQLWVHPAYRRLGLATQLKLQLEQSAGCHGVNLIYTHTEERNLHVIQLNSKLGYQEVRRGPIWDDIIRVSLIKQLL